MAQAMAYRVLHHCQAAVGAAGTPTSSAGSEYYPLVASGLHRRHREEDLGCRRRSPARGSSFLLVGNGPRGSAMASTLVLCAMAQRGAMALGAMAQRGSAMASTRLQAMALQ